MNTEYNKHIKFVSLFLFLLFCNITFDKIKPKKYSSYKDFFQDMEDEEIETDRCFLSLTKEKDIYDLAKNFLSEEIIGFFDTSIVWPKTVDEAEELLKSRLAERRNTYYFTIKLKKKGGECIGQIGFNLEKKNVLWVCYWLGPNYHCKGYMSEISLNLVELVFKSCEDLNTIIIRVDKANIGSKKIASKICNFIKGKNPSYDYKVDSENIYQSTRDKKKFVEKELVIFKIIKK